MFLRSLQTRRDARGQLGVPDLHADSVLLLPPTAVGYFR